MSQAEIDSAPDPFKTEWDTVVNWFYRQSAAIYLVTNKKINDTIHLGMARGLYCLLNIGDNNGDKKDELALVKDYVDFSNLNSCHIFSICNNKWRTLFSFPIHEYAFIFPEGNTDTVFTAIKGFLERHNNQWEYRAYKDEETQWAKLPLMKCR